MVNYDVLKIWNEKSVLGMVDVYADNLRKLKAIKIDWGRNENNLHIPITCRMLSQRLENMGVKHYAEEYIGDHWRQVATKDGRLLYDLLPFFDLYLTFE